MSRFLFAVLLSAISASAQPNIRLQSPITLPVSFVKSISASNAKPGDPVEAVTIQRVQLATGEIACGSHVLGHVVDAHRFVADKTPYAKQTAGTLTVHFDAVIVHGERVPLNVTVRALAGSIATWDTADAASSDLDSLGTRTQIGGDQLVPSQAEVRNADEDVVAYNKRDGVYAHLIASNGCDSSNQEVSVAMFSASACGLYGFGKTVATEIGATARPSTLTLASMHGSPEIWKHSAALLEVSPNQTIVSER